MVLLQVKDDIFLLVDRVGAEWALLLKLLVVMLLVNFQVPGVVRLELTGGTVKKNGPTYILIGVGTLENLFHGSECRSFKAQLGCLG